MKSDQVFETIKKCIYKVAPANPSGQDQLADHFTPHFALTMFFMTAPWWLGGMWLGLIVVGFALFKEFIEDKHWKNFFDKNDGTSSGGADGRCDLFFRLAGSLVAYATLIWR